MSINIARMLAWRYLQGTKEQPSLRIMVWICMIGIFIGTCALGLTTAIMNGFEKETHRKLQGVYPDVIIQAPHGRSIEEALLPYLKKTYGSTIAAISPTGIHHVLIQKRGNDDISIVALCKAVDPTVEAQTTLLQEKIVGGKTLPELVIHNQVIVGKEIAHSLNVHEGDELTMSYNNHPETAAKDADLSETTVVVAGILDTGIIDYDATLIIGSADFMNGLLEHPFINQIGIKCNSLLSEKKKNAFITSIKQLPDLTVSTWYDQYPAIVSALKLEKYAMSLLLGLITLVASMNSISLLFMFITHKRREIALLQSLGLGRHYIVLIFIGFNTLIAACASFLGLCAAYSIGTILQWYPCITLPDVYYVTTLPIDLSVRSFIFIFCGSLVVSILTSLIPLTALKNLSITNTLRFE